MQAQQQQQLLQALLAQQQAQQAAGIKRAGPAKPKKRTVQVRSGCIALVQCLARVRE
jgi:hypothetical protein